MNKKDIVILAFETSCDETSVAVVKNGREVLSNIISSQIEIHKRFGGVVPEVASRNHVLAITSVLNEALSQAKITLNDVDAVAVTYGAGLIGALMVGVTFAKTLAYSINKPLIKVNHIKGHIAANYIIDKKLKPPFTALVVSGGHTAVLEVTSFLKTKTLCTTCDDAIGEAFDKVARVLGLTYPGGPNLEKLALNGTINYKLFNYKLPNIDATSFSYSGLKTAVINFFQNKTDKGEEINKADISATFQHLAFEQVAKRAVVEAKKGKNKTLVVCGGVSANKYLQQMLEAKCKEEQIKFLYPPLKLCTDNAAMIGAEAYFLFIKNKNIEGLDLGAVAQIEL